MDEELMGIPLYKKLAPKEGDVKNTAVGYTALGTFLVLFCLAGVVMMAGDGTIDGAVIMAVIGIGCGIVTALVGRSRVRHKKQENVKKAERLAGLNAGDLMRIEDEISRTEERYKTLYLLDEYVYVPSAKLLLRYEHINGWKSVRHSTNGIPDSVWVEITEPDGFMTKVTIRKWRQYLQFFDDFTSELDAHRNKAIDALYAEG